jgi:pimeloyl-ACP methyl ester carboxylesterase
VLEVGDGPPTLHVHGGGLCGALHGPLAAALPGRRHLLIDRPGFGLSERADVAPNFRAHSVEFLVSSLDALGLGSVDIVANSIGAAMGLWLALEHPKRVRSLALVGAAAMLPGANAPFVFRLLGTPLVGRLILSLERPSKRQVANFFARFGHPPHTVHETIHDVMLALERQPSYPVAWRELLRATISATAANGQQPGQMLTAADLRRISCPVVFAWGSNDPTIDARVGRAAAAVLPDARFEIVGRGHAPWIDDPAAIARVLAPTLAPPNPCVG